MAKMNEQDLQKVLKSLKANRFDPVEYVDTLGEASKLVLSMIPQEAKVSMGGSTSLMQLGVLDELIKRGSMTLSRPDIYLTSSNAITMDGKLVNTDMTGNRVTSMIFGPKHVIVVAGTNKIVKDLDAAFDRIKTVIAPTLAKNAGLKTPCAVQGKCSDCNSPWRVCNITTVIEGKPRVTQLSVILVGEDIGLGWDPGWSDDRKEKIASVFKDKWAKMTALRQQAT